MSEIKDLNERERIAFEAHKDYVNRMHRLFGLKKHPGYCDVNIKPILTAGGFFYDPDTIWINDILTDKKEIRYVVCHESGHFLHPFARKEHKEGKRLEDFSLEDESLREMVAHLGNIIYWNIKEGKEGIREYKEYLLKTKDDSIAEAKIGHEIFLSDENINSLEKIANKDWFDFQKYYKQISLEIK